MLQSNAKFAALEKRMDGLEKRADTTDARFNKLEDSIGARFSQLELKVEADLRAFRAEHHRDLERIHEDFKLFYGMVSKLEGRVDEISKR